MRKTIVVIDACNINKSIIPSNVNVHWHLHPSNEINGQCLNRFELKFNSGIKKKIDWYKHTLVIMISTL